MDGKHDMPMLESFLTFLAILLNVRTNLGKIFMLFFFNFIYLILYYIYIIFIKLIYITNFHFRFI